MIVSQFATTSDAPDTLVSREHVRVAVNELADEPARDTIDVEPLVVGGHLRVEHDLQQQVTQLFFELGPELPPVDRVEDLVGFLEQVHLE